MAITPVSLFSDEWTTLNSIQSANSASSAERADKKASSSQGTAFDTFLNAAVDMYKEADSLQKSAESAEMSYALGYSDNIHDVAAAARKATVSIADGRMSEMSAGRISSGRLSCESIHLRALD